MSDPLRTSETPPGLGCTRVLCGTDDTGSQGEEGQRDVPGLAADPGGRRRCTSAGNGMCSGAPPT